jgi:hypothetical protein
MQSEKSLLYSPPNYYNFGEDIMNLLYIALIMHKTRQENLRSRVLVIRQKEDTVN